MKKIWLNDEEYTLVDDEDYDFLVQWKWCYHPNGYAIRIERAKINNKVSCKTVRMHRVVNNTPKEYLTDHINGNRLDNRKDNLRNCTHSENNMNRKSKHGASKYKGVSKDNGYKNWRAQIQKDGKVRHLGTFKCEKEAARTYNKAAKELFGEYARLNKIKRDE